MTTGTVAAPARLVIASRQSRLAMWQAEHVQARLRELYPRCEVEILGMTTEGDRVLDRALTEIGGKGLFIKELEVALLERRADLAVHSLKDVPMEVAEPFALAAIMAREDPRDAFVSAGYASLESLPAGARLGTSSLRRAAQIRRAFPALELLPLRGNVNTRLARLDEGRYDAIVLAAAGLERLGLAERIRAIVPPTLCLPAAGQGALAIETLASRDDLHAWLAPLDHPATAVEVHAERTVSRLLGGSCRVPLAAWCVSTPQGGLRLVARVAAEDGSGMVEAVAESAHADHDAAEAIGRQAARSLQEQGAARWLGSS
ncbi:MAG: hydroxymethylbilane synthase [Lautropia sp.]|nr:MAG: hydroxymethylbilane synthase [Pseudomonadota bacterium]MBC6960063.1 hydroxymethylbilane synthase [Lautropia sp.]MCL4702321.1 hydroxymethylbilane synthase [Burkholderiaceae bacterium]MCZ2412844.1 hydroxymethylbilane synthase [Burkholderiales bacterium]MDL1907580.1 hydroxymethylbilane synthase [Betaproteobacteria bacterium PRO1]